MSPQCPAESLPKAALSGLRVVEYGSGVSAAYAGRLLAGLGAEVIKVEAREGDEARWWGPFPSGRAGPNTGGLYRWFNGGKSGLTLDLLRAPDRQIFYGLLQTTALFVHNVHPGSPVAPCLDPLEIAERHPHLVMAAITPFGWSGPRSRWLAGDLVALSAGGWTWVNGLVDRKDLPPVKPFGQQSQYQAGLYAAIALLACLARDDPQGEFIDISVQECVAAGLDVNFVHFTYTGQVPVRYAPHSQYPWGIFPFRDGEALIICVEQTQWRNLLKLMGEPEWGEWEVFDTVFTRAANWDALAPLISDWTRGQRALDFYHAAQALRIPVAPVATVEGVLASPHLEARGYFVSVETSPGHEVKLPGAPFRMSGTPWRLASAAPTLGSAGAPPAADAGAGGGRRAARRGAPPEVSLEKPLQGLRVVDLTWVWAGPYATLQLAHLGAEVIRVESPTRLCLTRRVPPVADGVQGINRYGYFNQYNQGKKSVALDLSAPRAREVVKDLVRVADIVTENYSPGVMDRLGLGYRELRKVNPGVIMMSLSGFGATGPERDYVSYGPTQVAASGMAALTGYPGGPPMEVGFPYPDANSGLHAVVAILAALHHRRRTGRSQQIDVAMLECTVAVVAEGLVPVAYGEPQRPRLGNRSDYCSPHGVFRCRGEDRWVSIAVASDAQWLDLCAVMSRPDLALNQDYQTLAGRKANEDRLEAEVERWTRSQDRWTVAEVLQERRIEAYPCMSGEDLAADPQLRARGAFVELEHPEVGVRQHIGPPWRLRRRRWQVDSPAPLLGQHTEATLKSLLGYSDEQIEELRGSGAIPDCSTRRIRGPGA